MMTNKQYYDEKDIRGWYTLKDISYPILEGYKIVRVNGDKLYSSHIRGIGQVLYSIDEFVTPLPKCGSLTCFRNFMWARDYLHQLQWRDRETLQIYPCHYLPSNCVYVQLPIENRVISLTYLPAGTVLAEAIKLQPIKEI